MKTVLHAGLATVPDNEPRGHDHHHHHCHDHLLQQQTFEAQATAKKKITTLKKDARVLAEETSRYASSIEEKKSQLNTVASELENTTKQFGENNEIIFKLQGQVNDLLYQKQLNQERISYQQKYVKRIKELSGSGIDSSQHLNIERRLLSGQQSLDNVKEIINGLTNMHPHLHEVLSRVLTMADPGIDW